MIVLHKSCDLFLFLGFAPLFVCLPAFLSVNFCSLRRSPREVHDPSPNNHHIGSFVNDGRWGGVLLPLTVSLWCFLSRRRELQRSERRTKREEKGVTKPSLLECSAKTSGHPSPLGRCNQSRNRRSPSQCWWLCGCTLLCTWTPLKTFVQSKEDHDGAHFLGEKPVFFREFSFLD